jgi:hypothetical protein
MKEQNRKDKIDNIFILQKLFFKFNKAISFLLK